MARESFHMNDFIYKSAAIGMLVKPHVQANNTDNTKAPIYWPYVWWFRRWSIDFPKSDQLSQNVSMSWRHYDLLEL